MAGGWCGATSVKRRQNTPYQSPVANRFSSPSQERRQKSPSQARNHGQERRQQSPYQARNHGQERLQIQLLSSGSNEDSVNSKPQQLGSIGEPLLEWSLCSATPVSKTCEVNDDRLPSKCCRPSSPRGGSVSPRRTRQNTSISRTSRDNERTSAPKKSRRTKSTMSIRTANSDFSQVRKAPCLRYPMRSRSASSEWSMGSGQSLPSELFQPRSPSRETMRRASSEISLLPAVENQHSSEMRPAASTRSASVGLRPREMSEVNSDQMLPTPSSKPRFILKSAIPIKVIKSESKDIQPPKTSAACRVPSRSRRSTASCRVKSVRSSNTEEAFPLKKVITSTTSSPKASDSCNEVGPVSSIKQELTISQSKLYQMARRASMQYLDKIERSLSTTSAQGEASSSSPRASKVSGSNNTEDEGRPISKYNSGRVTPRMNPRVSSRFSSVGDEN